MIDYSYFYKAALPATFPWPAGNEWDLFFSAYTSAERVQCIHRHITASDKRWIIFPEYGYAPDEYPPGQYFVGKSHHEGDLIRVFWSTLPPDAHSKRICIDITGFIRPSLVFLLKWLQYSQVKTVDLLYSEPVRYAKGEATRFSDETVMEVRPIVGFEGSHSPDTSSDALVIGAGYDHKLIAEVAESKDDARKIQLFGLPSLRADMYQENVIRAYRAEEAVGAQTTDEATSFFAPANDPFATAATLREIVGTLSKRSPITNLYLSPLATKPQVVGFALYYLWEGYELPCSIIFPFSRSYSRETATGLARIWKFTAALPSFPSSSRSS